MGYTNAYVSLKAYPQQGGKVCGGLTSSSLKVWMPSFPLKTTFPVGSLMGVNVIAYYAFSQPAEGYLFGGWYEDTDGDGEFDITKDQQLSTEGEFFELLTLDDNATIYETEAAAKSAAKPDTPTRTIFGFFTNGASVDVAYRQGATVGNCGTVFIDKPINSPGDQVTVRALPNDGFQFEYWEDAPLLGNILSRDETYTFTVKGGDKLYAYFTAIDAPEVDLPEDGGCKVLVVQQPWVLSEEAMKAGAHVIVMEKEDLVRTDDGKTYLDMTKEECQLDVTQQGGVPTLVTGKGKVRFSFKDIVGVARATSSEALVQWSGSKGVTLNQEFVYVYLFHEDLGAFIQFAHSDTMVDPSASTKISIPAGWAYIALSAYDIVDNQTGKIPTVIGLSPETFDAGVSGIEGAHIEKRNLRGTTLYTLSGLQVKAAGQPGVYVVNGRKVVLKK